MTDFESVYDEYFHDVYRYTLSLCRSETTAEEVTQAAFCKALEGIDAFKGDSSLFAWLCQIAKNTYFSLYRRQKRCVSEPEPDAAASPRPDLEGELIDGETSRRLHQLLHELEEPYKEVFSLRVFGELPYAQIGELFNKTDSWARLVFYRAKKELWRRLNGHEM